MNARAPLSLRSVAERLFDTLLATAQAHPPQGVAGSDIDAFVARQRGAMVARLEQLLRPFEERILSRLGAAQRAGQQALAQAADEPYTWTPTRRIDANLAAMALLAATAPDAVTAADRLVLARYSGWGGLKLSRARGRFPEGMPEPTEEGLIHEYYTPARVWAAAAKWLDRNGMLEGLRDPVSGELRALEPSAGIGRALAGFGVRGLSWTAVELSAVSARLLRALYPDAEVHEGPFERFAVGSLTAQPRPAWDLVVSNPPYGPRGAWLELDTEPWVRTKRAYLYFLYRALSLLRKGGLGLFLVPTGWLTGTSGEMANARDKVLRRHHLAAAFRLPSVWPKGGSRADVVYERFVTDLLVFQSRGGQLAQVEEPDRFIAEGRYYKVHPEHILGTEVGLKAEAWEPGEPKARRGYQVQGAFEALPGVAPRPIQGTAQPLNRPKARDRGGIGRTDVAIDGLTEPTRDAIALGQRIDAWLAQVAAQDVAANAAWPELSADVQAWITAFGDPHRSAELRQATDRGSIGAARLLAAVESRPGGAARLGPALASFPDIVPRYQGELSVGAVATWLYRTRGGSLDLGALRAWWKEQTRTDLPTDAQDLLLGQGWCLDADDAGGTWGRLIPGEHYATGFLWPKVDRCRARLAQVPGDPTASRQLDALLQAIGWRDAASIAEECQPIDSWLPLDLVKAWAEHELGWPEHIELERDAGLLQPHGLPYDQLNNTDKHRTPGFTQRALALLGWANFDKQLWKVERDSYRDDNGKARREPMADARERWARTWTEAWASWLLADDERATALEESYNRRLRGFVTPTYSDEPLDIVRWRHVKGHTLRPHQAQVVRKTLDLGRQLIGFDVGVGKTYSGVAIVLKNRELGRARRPVVVVPNSIVWKWYRDFASCAPDLRVVVIGSERFPERQSLAEATLVARPGAQNRLRSSAPRARRRQAVLARIVELGETSLAQLDPKAASHVRKLVDADLVEARLPEPRMKARIETPQQRAEKWAAFQAGRYDVVLLTYSAMARQKIEPGFVRRYVEQTAVLMRSIKLSLRSQQAEQGPRAAAVPKEQTERQQAVERNRIRAWVGDILSPPDSWDYDPGVDWHALGVDLLIVDEAQNFKNLLYSEREGGDREAAKRAWQLDFRCASVREHTGGGGVVLLSATPAKNSPVEFYTMIHLLGPELWQQVGIDNHESFLARFARWKKCNVLDASGTKVVQRDVVVGWQNLGELRDVLSRWATFKTAEEVGLKLPDVTVEQHAVDRSPAMTDRLGELYQDLQDVEEAITNAARMGGERNNPAVWKALIQKRTAIAVRIYLTYQHPDLPGIGKVSAKAAVRDYEASDGPKLVACAKNILATAFQTCRPRAEVTQGQEWCLDCGHIVFCDNPAVHYWMRHLLVQAGLPHERIAILNAHEAKDLELRQQIAERFNGVGQPGDDDHEAPDIDVVIANAVAYEGMDLQRRTCAIHHLDVPWEPATLQQRNGRGVRQGNLFSNITIHYYFVRGSNENWRVQRIESKRQWMKDLVAGQDRSTNTTGRSTGCGVTDEDLDASLNHAPPAVRQRILKLREERRGVEQEQQQEAARKELNRELRGILRQLNRAGRALTVGRGVAHERAKASRTEAEGKLRRLLQDAPKDAFPAAWRWHRQAERLLTSEVEVPYPALAWVPPVGPLFFPGDAIRFGGEGGPTWVVGLPGERFDKRGAWFRRADSLTRWVFVEDDHKRFGDQIAQLAWLAPDDLRALPDTALSRLSRDPRYWSEEWRRLDPTTRATLWPRLGPTIQRRVSPLGRSVAAWPVVVRDGALLLCRAHDGCTVPDGAELVPPTLDGWQRFRAIGDEALVQRDDIGWSALNQAAQHWWGWAYPRGTVARPEEG